MHVLHLLTAPDDGCEMSSQALEARGILVTASAGNSALNTDSNPHVPSTLTGGNLIAVGAAQQDGQLWSGSNYGEG